jgi:hypothetical protein
MWPEDLLYVLSVTVAGRPWEPSDRETVRQFESGELRMTGYGVWYEGTDKDGARKLYLYPAPASTTLELEWVYEAPAFNVDEPNVEPSEFPAWFHEKLVHFVGEIYYGTVEDNPELAEVQKGKADLALSELVRYDNERASGDGIFIPGIVGVTA